MGGSKLRDTPSNIVLMCSLMNGLMESNPHSADRAREMGWKLSGYAQPAQVPLWDANLGEWVLLDDEYGKVPVAKP